MGEVWLDISMSLDGFITATNRRPEEPLGDGGLQLHEWAFNRSDERNRKLLEESVGLLGAVIAGRSTYDDAIPGWKTDGPTGSARVPVFVVSHTVPDDIPEGGVYTFVDGIENALARAQETAGDKNISVMGGANIAQQFLKAGLIDRISIHLVPVLFCGGTPLFDHLGSKHIQLETTEEFNTKEATHIRYRVRR